MPAHEAITYGELTESIRERIDSLSELINLVRDKAAEHGMSDVVIKVEVEGKKVQAAAYDRSSFQSRLLANEPRDSAEDESFFVTLNDPVVGGFWVVLQFDDEPHEYLFQMVGHNVN